LYEESGDENFDFCKNYFQNIKLTTTPISTIEHSSYIYSSILNLTIPGLSRIPMKDCDENYFEIIINPNASRKFEKINLLATKVCGFLVSGNAIFKYTSQEAIKKILKQKKLNQQKKKFEDEDSDDGWGYLKITLCEKCKNTIVDFKEYVEYHRKICKNCFEDDN